MRDLLGILSNREEIEHYQMQRHHEVVPEGTSEGLPLSLQKPLGSYSWLGRQRLQQKQQYRIIEVLIHCGQG